MAAILTPMQSADVDWSGILHRQRGEHDVALSAARHPRLSSFAYPAKLSLLSLSLRLPALSEGAARMWHMLLCRRAALPCRLHFGARCRDVRSAGRLACGQMVIVNWCRCVDGVIRSHACTVVPPAPSCSGTTADALEETGTTANACDSRRSHVDSEAVRTTSTRSPLGLCARDGPSRRARCSSCEPAQMIRWSQRLSRSPNRPPRPPHTTHDNLAGRAPANAQRPHSNAISNRCRTRRPPKQSRQP